MIGTGADVSRGQRRRRRRTVPNFVRLQESTNEMRARTDSEVVEPLDHPVDRRHRYECQPEPDEDENLDENSMHCNPSSSAYLFIVDIDGQQALNVERLNVVAQRANGEFTHGNSWKAFDEFEVLAMPPAS